MNPIVLAEFNEFWFGLIVAFAVLLMIGAVLEFVAFYEGNWHPQYTFSAAVRRWSHKRRWISAVVPALLCWLVFHLWVSAGV